MVLMILLFHVFREFFKNVGNVVIHGEITLTFSEKSMVIPRYSWNFRWVTVSGDSLPQMELIISIMVVTTFGSLWDIIVSYTCYSIVHCSPSMYLFITYQSYQFILNPHLSRSGLSFTQNNSATSSVPYMDFRHSSYIILRNLSSLSV